MPTPISKKGCIILASNSSSSSLDPKISAISSPTADLINKKNHASATRHILQYYTKVHYL